MRLEIFAAFFKVARLLRLACSLDCQFTCLQSQTGFVFRIQILNLDIHNPSFYFFGIKLLRGLFKLKTLVLDPDLLTPHHILINFSLHQPSQHTQIINSYNYTCQLATPSKKTNTGNNKLTQKE